LDAIYNYEKHSTFLQQLENFPSSPEDNQVIESENDDGDRSPSKI